MFTFIPSGVRHRVVQTKYINMYHSGLLFSNTSAPNNTDYLIRISLFRPLKRIIVFGCWPGIRMRNQAKLSQTLNALAAFRVSWSTRFSRFRSIQISSAAESPSSSRSFSTSKVFVSAFARLNVIRTILKSTESGYLQGTSGMHTVDSLLWLRKSVVTGRFLLPGNCFLSVMSTRWRNMSAAITKKIPMNSSVDTFTVIVLVSLIVLRQQREKAVKLRNKMKHSAVSLYKKHVGTWSNCSDVPYCPWIHKAAHTRTRVSKAETQWAQYSQNPVSVNVLKAFSSTETVSLNKNNSFFG